MGEHELTLDAALDETAAAVDQLMTRAPTVRFSRPTRGYVPSIDAFFDNVMVMDEDLALRANRLALLARFVDMFQRFADFGKLAV